MELSLLTREHGGDEVEPAAGHPPRGEVADEAVEALVRLEQVEHAELALHAVVLFLLLHEVVDVALAVPAPAAAAASTAVAVAAPAVSATAWGTIYPNMCRQRACV